MAATKTTRPSTEWEGSIYSRDFFERQSRGSATSASIVVPVVLRILDVHSVIDVGCGIGTWAAEFLARGVPAVLGVDGTYVDENQLLIPRDHFLAHNLARPFTLNRRFDLAVCLEVAEHLPPERSSGFVADLVALAPAVLFSAAIPGQGGQCHVNEHYLSYWTTIFRQHEYKPLDLIRPAIWEADQVDWWYRQNMLLLVAPGHPLHEVEMPVARDLVHPVLYGKYLRTCTTPTLGFLIRSLPGSVRRSVRRRFGKCRSSS